MLGGVKTQKPVTIAMTDCRRRHHLGVQQRTGRKLTVEHAAMPVRPVHHGRNAEPRSLHVSGCLDLHPLLALRFDELLMALNATFIALNCTWFANSLTNQTRSSVAPCSRNCANKLFFLEGPRVAPTFRFQKENASRRKPGEQPELYFGTFITTLD
jgi:hypothetical protein